TGGAMSGLARCAVGTGFEACITQAMKTTLGHFQFLAVLGEIAEDFLGIHINDRGAHGHGQNEVRTLVACAVLAAALLAIFGLVFGLKAVVDQCVEIFIGDKIDAAAVTAVATVGAAFGDKFFLAEAHHAIATFPGLNL